MATDEQLWQEVSTEDLLVQAAENERIAAERPWEMLTFARRDVARRMRAEVVRREPAPAYVVLPGADLDEALALELVRRTA